MAFIVTYWGNEFAVVPLFVPILFRFCKELFQYVLNTILEISEIVVPIIESLYIKESIDNRIYALLRSELIKPLEPDDMSLKAGEDGCLSEDKI